MTQHERDWVRYGHDALRMFRAREYISSLRALHDIRAELSACRMFMLDEARKCFVARKHFVAKRKA